MARTPGGFLLFLWLNAVLIVVAGKLGISFGKQSSSMVKPILIVMVLTTLQINSFPEEACIIIIWMQGQWVSITRTRGFIIFYKSLRAKEVFTFATAREHLKESKTGINYRL